MKKLIKKYKHALWALAVVLYIVYFFFIEKLVPSTTDYFVSYCKLDDYIPFCDWFVIFYLLWFPSMFGVGIVLLLTDGDGFRRFIWALLTGFFLSSFFMLLFPNGQNLRPFELITEAERESRTVFVDYGVIRDNLFTKLIASLYKTDTNTNVLPSMHVIGAMVCVFGLGETKAGKKPAVKAASWLLASLIGISTCFIKQHSVLDVLTGAFVGALLYLFFYVFVKKKMEERKSKRELQQ